MKSRFILWVVVMMTSFSLTAQEYASELHKNSVGKIFFTKNVKTECNNAAEFVAVFTDQDDIVACVFLQPNEDGRIRFKGQVVVDGQKPGYELDSEKNKFAFSFNVLSKNFYVETGEFSSFVRTDMKNGEHKILIEIWDKYDGPDKVLASGEFTLNKGGAAAGTSNAGAKFSAIKAGMSNPTLEQQALNVINTRAKNENWDEKYTKAKIISTAWEVRKNPVTGAIEDRIIYMKLLAKWPDGKCKVVDFGFRQDYSGGQYSTLKFNSIGEMTPAVCE
jgi:hypothetical protein